MTRALSGSTCRHAARTHLLLQSALIPAATRSPAVVIIIVIIIVFFILVLVLFILILILTPLIIIVVVTGSTEPVQAPAPAPPAAVRTVATVVRIPLALLIFVAHVAVIIAATRPRLKAFKRA